MVTLPSLSFIWSSVSEKYLVFKELYSDSVVMVKKMSSRLFSSTLPLHTALAWFKLHCQDCLQAENDFLGVGVGLGVLITLLLAL